MTTTRSLLPDAVTAGWISLYLQAANSFWLIASRVVPSSRPSLRRGSVGRSWKPLFCASAIDCWRRARESGWHTTRVLALTPVLVVADASVRASGTAPPAAGCAEVSGRGTGQYAARPTGAPAGAASPRASVIDPTTPAIVRLPIRAPPCPVPGFLA